jgi:phospholipid/cholesterol/gamma-HCH transport system substrate-binding protein
MKIAVGSKIRLGIFVCSSITILIVAIYFIGQRQQLFSSTFQISGVFKDINGLQIGNNVRFSGINIGVVNNIQQLTDSTVIVDMSIDHRSQKFIKKNAKAIIGTDGLMGNKIISITPGTIGKPAMTNNDTIETVQPININDILLNIKVCSENIANITGNFSEIMQNVRDGNGVVGKLLMDTVLALNLEKALVNIKQGAGGFKQNMDAASHSFFLRGYLKKKAAKDAKK